MDIELKRRAAQIINEHILTPVIYMLESDEQVEFICFCDVNIEPQEFAAAEKKLNDLLGVQTVVFDLREYNEADRVDIIHDGDLIYTANPAFEKLFAMSMAEDLRRAAVEKSELLKRYDTSGTVYLQ